MADSILIEWARAEAARLVELANGPIVPVPFPATARARQFLADHAAGSMFTEAADNSFNNAHSNAEPILGIAFQLEEWAIYEESDISHQKPFDVRFRMEAATDIMEQAQQLLMEGSIHLAAPVVLAGAALEEFLRSMQVDCGQPIVGKAGISSYAEALRKVELITRGEMKEITAWTDQRNDAAHGRFDDLTRARTLLMIEGINLFITKHTDPV